MRMWVAGLRAQAIEKAAQVPGLRWLDVNYPFNSPDDRQDRRAGLERTGIRAIAITPHVHALLALVHQPRPRGPPGGRRPVQGIEVADELDASYLKFWPGQDGHDYLFQAEHARLWTSSWMACGGGGGVGAERQFAIEYKLKEPRNHMAFSTAARTLLGIEDIGAANLGIVLDMGHPCSPSETPADVLQLVHRRGRLVSVEVNDNLREWDDDMVVGSVHPVETLEFLWGLRQIGWDRPVLLDQFPFREDPVGAATLSLQAIEGMERMLDRIDASALKDAQERQDALAAWWVIVLREMVGAGASSAAEGADR
ncbi:MAG: sugar phosphate isomerase/epimerase [Chloroflexota bacterium]